ncbi:hypothetical protein OHA10_31755 [Kribbella sp. NBC_00662]|uniref:hypothetical protein n=1 Tax=Kribbella sp. NBC_00662 TaxID=2975969 RepID=UPI003254EA4A
MRYLSHAHERAPLMVRVADDMLADLRADVAERCADRIVALGRDGHHLALAMTRLDGQFFRQYGSNLVLSRALVENALQDLEHHQGLRFPQVDGFRRVAPRVDPADTVGGFRQLTDYLQANRVPVGRPGSRATVFDTSFKGTVQELLSAVYPETTFTGRYAFLGESPHDPHPGSKKGYEVHLSAAETRQGRPLYELPADESMLLEGLSRGRVSPRLRDLRVREGVKVVNLMAVADLARDVAGLRDAGGNYRSWLDDLGHAIPERDPRVDRRPLAGSAAGGVPRLVRAPRRQAAG